MKKFISAIFTIALILLMICLVAFPERYLSCTFEGIKLWAFAVLPSLLPFFFLTALLTSTGTLSKFSKSMQKITKPLFNCSGISCYTHLMSILSGYPIGAKIIADLKQNNVISKAEATRMSTFCSTSGPLFIVGSVGIAMFQNKTLGLVFLCVHVLSSVFCGICFRKYGDNRLIGQFIEKSSPLKGDNVLYDCIYQSVISIIIVGGFVAIFYTFSQILHDFKILIAFEKMLAPLLGNDNSQSFCQGLIECTMGCKKLSSSNSVLSKSLACGLISFGGISVMCQSIIFLKKAEAKISVFVCSKFIQMLFSIVLCFILSNFNVI